MHYCRALPLPCRLPWPMCMPHVCRRVERVCLNSRPVPPPVLPQAPPGPPGAACHHALPQLASSRRPGGAAGIGDGCGRRGRRAPRLFCAVGLWHRGGGTD